MMIAWLIRRPGRWRLRKAFAFLALLITCQGLSVAQQEITTCSSEMKYENHNQIDYGPLTVRDLKGQVTDVADVPIPQACLGVYTETERKLIASTTSDENGAYKFDKIRPGQYRLVVLVGGFCAANTRVVIASNLLGSIRNRPVYVHMRVRGIDDCSYVDHTRSGIKNGR
jgi:protocatechuate 3,4-dioxygenase beta subunit